VFVLWTRLRVSFNAYVNPLFEIPSDLPGVNPATNDRMILYYCLMTKVDGSLGDSTVFSWAGCHNFRCIKKEYVHYMAQCQKGKREEMTVKLQNQSASYARYSYKSKHCIHQS
jgi:hypothetical protein